MYTPIEKAPPKFMKRYQAIMNGTEQLDTPQKLKDFWLFAIEQGWKNYEMREYIALLTEAADWTSPLVTRFSPSRSLENPPEPNYTTHLFEAHAYFRDFKSMDESPYPEEQTDEEYLDAQWAEAEKAIRYFKPEIYDAFIKSMDE